MINQKMVEPFHSEYQGEIQGDDYLQHYGVLGMKWGVRRYQNSDGTLTSAGKKRYLSSGEKTYKRLKKVDTAEGDVFIPKGHTFQRVYTEYDRSASPSFKNKRLYISDSAKGYLNDYFISDVSKTRIQTFKSNKELVFAGEESINKILKDIGNKPLNKVFDEHGNYSTDKSGTDRDFLLNDAEIGEKFIKEALARGFDGVRDPVDDIGVGYELTAKILFDIGGVHLIKDESLDKYL